MADANETLKWEAEALIADPHYYQDPRLQRRVDEIFHEIHGDAKIERRVWPNMGTVGGAR